MCSSYIGIPSNSWVDDYLDWLNPGSKCCRRYTTANNFGEFCPAHECENHRIETHQTFWISNWVFLLWNRNPFSFISKQLLWNVFGTAFPTVKTLYGPACNNSISTWKSFWTTGPTWSVLKGTLRHCANTIIQTPANNALIKRNISSHSGLGAYDKAVVIGEDGEILGEQILFLTFLV